MKARRWRVKAPDHSACELYFASGIDREQLQTLYRGCHVEAIDDDDRGQRRDDAREADDGN